MKKKVLFTFTFLLILLFAVFFLGTNKKGQTPYVPNLLPTPTIFPQILEVVSAGPKDNSKNVPLVTDLSLELNSPVDPSTVFLSVSPNIAFSKPQAVGKHIIFAQLESFSPNTVYNISVSGVVSYSWSFTTGAGGAGQNLNYVKDAQKIAPTGLAGYQKALNKNYLIDKMPYSSKTFSISYSISVDLFTITVLAPSGKDDAFSWIKSQDVDPSKLRIQNK